MANEPVLCRGWTASAVRAAVLLASADQQNVLREIALHSPVTAAEVADAVGRSYPSVRAGMAAWSRKTATLGIKDPATGAPSWPWTYGRRKDGSTDYLVNAEVRAAILSVTGES